MGRSVASSSSRTRALPVFEGKALREMLLGAASAFDLSGTRLILPVFADDGWADDWLWVASAFWDGMDAFRAEQQELYPGQERLFDADRLMNSTDG